MEADPLFATFDLADVNGMEVGFFRELFLAQASPGPVASDRVAQDFQVRSSARHKSLEKQIRREVNTPNMGVFIFLRSGGDHYKMRRELDYD